MVYQEHGNIKTHTHHQILRNKWLNEIHRE